MKNYIVLFISVFLTMTSSIFAQFDCPPGGGWTKGNRGDYSFAGLYIGAVDFYSRFNNGAYEVVIDWASLKKNSELQTSTVQEILLKQIIPSFKKCPSVEEETTVRLIEKKECKVMRYCYVKLTDTQEGICCDPGFGSPDIINYSGVSYGRRGNPISCGFQCCQTEYKITCLWNELRGVYVQQVRKVGVSTYNNMSCQPLKNYKDCLTGLPSECMSEGCE